jgi:hypothetical protein
MGCGITIASMELDLMLLGLGILAITFIPVVKILRKAGYSGWWGLLWAVPAICLVTIWVYTLADLLLLVIAPIDAVLVWVFAFADWPNLAKQST